MIDEIEDGRLPPEIWLSKSRWYPTAGYDPRAIRHIEHSGAREGAVLLLTPSRTVPDKTYRQYYQPA